MGFKAEDQRQKSSILWCCLMHSFGIFQVISAGRCVSVLCKGRGGLNTSCNSLALPQTFATNDLHEEMRKALEHLAWRLAAGTTSAWVSSLWRPVLSCRERTLALCLQGCLVSAGNPKAAYEKGVRLQSHLSLLCLPGWRWFPHSSWFYCTSFHEYSLLCFNMQGHYGVVGCLDFTLRTRCWSILQTRTVR